MMKNIYIYGKIDILNVVSNLVIFLFIQNMPKTVYIYTVPAGVKGTGPG